MIRLIWTVSVHTRYFLRRYMPTNILLDAIPNPPWFEVGIPAMLLAIPYASGSRSLCPTHQGRRPRMAPPRSAVGDLEHAQDALDRAGQRCAPNPRPPPRDRHRPSRARQLARRRRRRAGRGGRDRYPLRCENSGTDPATTAGTDRPAAREHRRAHGLMADSEPRGNLSQRQPTCVEPSGVLSDRVRQLRATRRQARLPSNLPHGAAVHVESRRKLPHGHTIGVPGEQLARLETLKRV